MKPNLSDDDDFIWPDKKSKESEAKTDSKRSLVARNRPYTELKDGGRQSIRQTASGMEDLLFTF